jgi:uracil-DNA glycosylase
MADIHANYLKAMGIVQWRLREGAPSGAGIGHPERHEAMQQATRPALQPDPQPEPQPEPEGSEAPTPAPGSPADEDGIGHLDWDPLQDTVAACTRCELHRTRTQTVFGVGNREAEWMFVGEAPGAEEDRRGEPFVGRAGKLLDAMLATVGRTREDVYIANVLKCRPPKNRDPQGKEVQECGTYLLRQIDLVRPRLLIAMGRFAAQSLLNTSRPIGKLRGEVFEHAASGIPLVVTYHPAYLLRNPLDKRKAWQDLCLIRRVTDTP